MSTQRTKKPDKAYHKYNLWTSPPSEWTDELQDFEITDEIRDKVKNSPRPEKKEIQKLTKPYNVRISKDAYSFIIK